MSNPTGLKRNVGARGKQRVVPKSKWELPYGDSKPYWDKICKDIESRLSKTVSDPSPSHPVLDRQQFLPSFSIRSSTASSVISADATFRDFPNREPTPEIDKASRSIIDRAPPSASPTDSIITAKLSSDDPTISPDTVECPNNRSSSPKDRRGLVKLSKMTTLVNNFLSTLRPRMRLSPRKPKKSPPFVEKTSRKEPNGESAGEKSSQIQRHDDISTRRISPEGLREKKASIGDAISDKKTVGFLDDFGEPIGKYFQRTDGIATKPRRTRAPSLGVASSVPSFGKVVISVEDVDSPENKGGRAESLDSVEADEVDFVASGKPGDYLKVPEVRSADSPYPTRQGSADRQLKEFYDRTLPSRKKHLFQARKSIVHVLRALETTRTGSRAKARSESERKEVSAAPLEINSSSARSSMSSDRTDPTRVDFPIPEGDKDDTMNDGNGRGNEWREEIDKESSDAFWGDASARERSMRRAAAHLSEDPRRDAAGTCIGTPNALRATFERANSPSLYNSWVTSENGVAEKRRNKETSDRRFAGIPRLRRIYPRVKADKCLACMCRSLGDMDRPRGKKVPATFSHNRIDYELVVNDDETSTGAADEGLPIGASIDQFSRDRCWERLWADKMLAKSSAGPLVVDEANDEAPPANSRNSTDLIQKSADDTSRSCSRLDDPQVRRSNAIAESVSTTAALARSLIPGPMSERTRSTSDQDDSDQGCGDPVGDDGRTEGNITSKCLAPCHMPINLKPSLEPLKALRSKKSRSIRSRVASAEKSGGSATDDDDDSVHGGDVGGRSSNEAKDKSKSEATRSDEPEKTGLVTPGHGTGDLKDAGQGRSAMEARETVPGKTDVDNGIKTNLVDNPAVISDREVVEISRKCLNNDMTIAETLRVLADEYIDRLSDRHSRKTLSPRPTNVRDNEKVAINLMTLLVESKSYSSREKRPNDPPDQTISSKQPSLCNSRQLKRILPLKSYNLVAPILGMAEWYPDRKSSNLRDVGKMTSRMRRDEESLEETVDTIVRPSSRFERVVSFEKNWKDNRPRLNPYALFFTKPRRKVVTWRPLTERDLEGYDPEATLKKRAAKITDRICEDFVQWLESLAAGTNQRNTIDVEVLKDMFETDFTADVCNTMQMWIKEMPMVPTAVAVARNCPEAGELALTRRHLVKDAEAETRPKRVVGFGTSLSQDLKFIPPRNEVDKKWLQCENVPKDLESMEAVWKGITHLTSVKSYVKWLRAHPEVKRPKNLENMLTSRRVLGSKKSMVDDFKHLELDLDQIQSLKVADNVPEAQ